MLWVYLSDGQTLHFDILKPGELEAWNQRSGDLEFQRSITGVALYHEGQLQTLTRPGRFRRVKFLAEVFKRKGHPVERVTMEADGLMLSISAYRNNARPQVTAVKLRRGKRVYRPGG